MKWLNAFSFTPGTNQCWFFGNREIDCSMTLADVTYLYKDSLESIDPYGFLPNHINQYIVDPIGFMGDNDRDPHALREQLGFEPQDTCIRRRVSCYIIPQDNTCSKDHYPMNVSVPDTLLYMDDFVPYSNKILMQNPGDIPWHMIELVEGDAVVLAAADTADSGDSFALLPVELNDTPTECPSGYYGDGAICTKCPAGSYCPAGATTPTTCPDNSTSVEGSAVCTCDAGHSVGGAKTTTTTVGAACVANTYTVTLDANGGTGCMMTVFNK